MDFLIILLFGFAIMWLLIVMPQRRRQKAHDEMVGALSPGDYVLTAGGVYGTVTEIGADDVGLEVAPDIEIRVSKRAIGTLVPPDQIEEVEVGDEEPAATPADEKQG